MRKIFVRMLALAMIAIVVIAMTACGRSELEGTWVRDGLGLVTLEFRGDRFTLTYPRLHSAHDTAGTFVIADNRVELTHDRGSSRVHNFTLTGNTLTISGMGTFHRE